MPPDASATDTPPPPTAVACSPLAHTARAVVCGMAMGTADAVPGVSGGTIALILGIYERFIGSLADVVAVIRHPRDHVVWRRALQALVFLAPLGIGLLGAYYVATKLLVGELETPTAETWAALNTAYTTTPPPGWLVNPATAPYVFAFFFGLVLFSVNEPWKEKSFTVPIDWLLLLVGAGLAAWLGLSSPAAGSTAPWALVGAGAIAISVMLLPGVSGSLALLVLGMYQIVSGAIHGREWDVIVWFGAGIAGGVALFVPVLRWLLARVHDRTMSLLSGLMLGSLAALWPWKAHYWPKFIPFKGAMSPEMPGDGWWGPVLTALCGGAVILLAGKLARSRSS